jgi:hypothetical protein
VAYLENKEDILYQRYNQELWDRIKEKVLDGQKDSMDGLQDIFWDSVDLSKVTWPELLNVPDIQTRHIINKSTKKFVEIFSKWSIGELRKNVHNAWRYNYPWNKVNADFIPYLITILDSVNDEIIKEANDDFELQIDQKVINELQTNIQIPTNLVITKGYKDTIKIVTPKTCQDADWNDYDCTTSDDVSENHTYWDHYINMYFWKQWWNISLAEQCTIYRWANINHGTI